MVLSKPLSEPGLSLEIVKKPETTLVSTISYFAVNILLRSNSFVQEFRQVQPCPLGEKKLLKCTTQKVITKNLYLNLNCSLLCVHCITCKDFS